MATTGVQMSSIGQIVLLMLIYDYDLLAEPARQSTFSEIGLGFRMRFSCALPSPPVCESAAVGYAFRSQACMPSLAFPDRSNCPVCAVVKFNIHRLMSAFRPGEKRVGYGCAPTLPYPRWYRYVPYLACRTSLRLTKAPNSAERALLVVDGVADDRVAAAPLKFNALPDLHV